MVMFRKELSRLFKKPSTFFVLVIAPLLVAGLGVMIYSNYGVKNMKIGFVNLNRDPIGGFTVRLIISFFHGGSVVQLSEKNYENAIMKGKVHAVIIIPEDFTKLLYARKQSYLWFIPSPYDLQIAAGIYTVIKSLFDDLEGSMFFDPKVLRYLFVGKGYPAPKLLPKYGGKALSFDSLLAPAVVFLSGILAVLTLSSLSVIEDREKRLVHIYRIADLGSIPYTISYTMAYALIGMLESSVAYIVYRAVTGTGLPLRDLAVLIVLDNVFHALLGFIISALSPNKGTALMLMTVTLGLVFFSSGTLVPLLSVPEFLRSFIKSTVIYNTTLIMRKVQIFPHANVLREYLIIILSTALTFPIAILSGTKVLRRD